MLSMSITDHNTPPYYFTVSADVEAKCPTILDGKQILAEDFIPSRARPKDTGYDVRCANPDGVELIPGSYLKMRLGFRMYAPDGWWLSLSPRSGTFVNHNIHALYGVIDETYENEMCFVGQYIPDVNKLLPNSQKVRILFGQRFAQIIPCPRWDMPDPKIHRLSNEDMDRLYQVRNDSRGKGGFGSSGHL